MAESIGIGRQQVNNILAGKTSRPHKETLRGMADYLGMDLNFDAVGYYFQPKQDQGLEEDAEHGIIRNTDQDYRTRPKSERLPAGLLSIKNNTALRDQYNITDREIEVTATSKFYGGGQDRFTPEQWLEVILLIKKVGLGKE